MTDRPDQQAEDADAAPSKLGRLASGVAKGVQNYKDSRPLASVDAGIGKLTQIHRAFTGTRFTLYADRIETPKGEHPLTPSVHAEVDAAGGFQKRVDKRELYLTIEGDGWSISHQCDHRKGEKVRGFAHAVNAAVRALPTAQPPQAADTPPGQPPSPASDAAEAIRRLGDLRDAGVLSESEFETKKRELLGRM